MTADAAENPRYVVLIGAARSGTRMLRDALARAMGVGAVPYDIGYVWRMGVPAAEDDTLAGVPRPPHVERFIRRHLARYASGQPPTVIEKTVGNTLRVSTVAHALPGAMFVHLVRDGVDAIESTRREWMAPPDWRYLFGKGRHFPLRLVPSYGREYIQSVARRFTSSDRRVGIWGVRYPGIHADLAVQSDLLVVCARQWGHAVRRARAELSVLDRPVLDVRYEDVVADPRAALARLARFIGMPTSEHSLEQAAASIANTRRGVGRRALTPPELEIVEHEVGDVLAELGYPPALMAATQDGGN